MKSEIIYTFDEYKIKYNDLLKVFLLNFIDYDELDFVKNEIYYFEMYLANTIIDYKSDKKGYYEPETNTFIVGKNQYPNIDEIHSKALKYKGAYENEAYDLFAFSFKKIIKFLETRKNSIKNNTQPQQNESLIINKSKENLHPTMFINDSFKLFEYILENHISSKRGRINDISFYYWKMYNEKLIIQKPYPFKDWFSENYTEVIEKIQTLESVSNPNRLKHYSTSLDWYKTVK